MLETNKALISKEERVCGWRLAGLVTLLSSPKYESGAGVAGLLAVGAAAAVCYHDRCWSFASAPFCPRRYELERVSWPRQAY